MHVVHGMHPECLAPDCDSGSVVRLYFGVPPHLGLIFSCFFCPGVLSAMRRYHGFVPPALGSYFGFRGAHASACRPAGKILCPFIYLSFPHMAAQRSAVPLSALMRLIRLVRCSMFICLVFWPFVRVYA